jgi:hypothetical protein
MQDGTGGQLMASEGELVRMQNGRWARFQRCTVFSSGADVNDGSVLVAVELSDSYQQLLDAAEDSLRGYRQKGIPVQLRLNFNGDGKLSLNFEFPQSAAVH